MGLEKIHFFWYVKKISGLALFGYLAGAGTYLAQYPLLHEYCLLKVRGFPSFPAKQLRYQWLSRLAQAMPVFLV